MSKTVIITGCSKKDGVGYNLGKALLNRGHQVIATVRNLENSEIALTEDGFDLRTLDLTDQASIESFIGQVLNDYPCIDVLVNNAADVTIGAAETASRDDMLTTYQTKVFGPLQLVQGFVPLMRKHKQGLITTTGSIFCSMPFAPPGISPYLSALNAFERIQEALSIELAPWNIKVVNFHPGPISTRLTRSMGSHTDIESEYYATLTDKAYRWFQQLEYQDAEAVAKAFADVIEKPNPDFHEYSSDFGRHFAHQYQSDTSANSYRQRFVEHFMALPTETSSEWHLPASLSDKHDL